MAKSEYVLFRVSIVLGLLLGLGLLVETVETYRYVSGNLIRQEAQKEAQRKSISFERTARAAKATEADDLAPILDEIRRESARQISWARLVGFDGVELAVSGKPTGQAFSAARIREALDKHNPLTEIRQTESGRVLVVMQPIRAGRPTMAEMAIYLDSVSVSFGLLRQHLIVGCLAAFALLAAMIIIGLRFGHYMRGKQLEQQVDLARSVQKDLLPSGGPMGEGIDFAADCIQASQVGGDFYDVFEVEGGQSALVLGDVSGKGLPAALLMGVIHGAVRSSAWTGSASNHEESSCRLNRLLCAKTAHERFASLFSCYFDPHSARLRYVNAGHLPPLLVSQDELGELSVKRLDDGGPVLGLLPFARYRQGEVRVEPGDLLVMYSDGILEAQGTDEEEFGE
ncbi:MAG: PP2C family protein-serine/threonine phosphatase, partial [Bryobacteraceae bacterium]